VPGSVSYADWSLSWEIPTLKGGGLAIRKATYGGTIVLWEAGAPFVLIDYHSNHPIFKDGLGPTTPGASFLALTPNAPNAKGSELFAGIATNDNQYDADTNPNGAVMVEQHGAELSMPAHLVLWAKFLSGDYQYIHRWEFGADGSIHAQIGLGGQLWSADPGPDGVAGGRAHIHNFYFRLDFDIAESSNNLVQEFVHTDLSALAGDKWIDLKKECKRVVNPAQFTKWRVVNKVPKADGQLRGYELIGGSEGPPDGAYSTGDLWVVRYEPNEDGSKVGVDDSVLEKVYAGGASPQTVDGQDVVVWYCLRTHHLPRHRAEEDKVLPYEFIGFRIETRDFLDHTPAALYTTTPVSP
jgi:primary-amine oxidase